MAAEKTVQLKREIIRMLGGKRLQQVGGSKAIIIPSMWAKANAVEIDGDYYIKVKIMSDGVIQLEPLDKEELNTMLNGVADAN